MEPNETPTERIALRSVRRGGSTLQRMLAGIALFILPFAALIAAVGSSGGAALVSVVLIAVVAVIGDGARRRRGGEAVLERDRLTVRGRGFAWHVTSGDVESAYHTERTGRAVLLLDNGRRVELEPDGEDPRRILDHLGQTLDKRALEAPLRGVLGAFTMGLLATMISAPLIVGALGSAAHWLGRPGVGLVALWPLFSLLVGVLFARRFGHPKVVVGADGVVVKRSFSSRFIPFSKIATVDATTADGATGVLLGLIGGEWVELPTIGQDAAQRGALAQRIRDGMQKQHPRGPSVGDLLALGGRTIGAWRGDLARLAASAGGFRDAAVQPSDLEAELDNPSAPVERRLGAALALRSLDPAAVTRIRVAAAKTADEHVRVALETVAGDEIDDDAVEEVLRRRA